MPRQCELIPSAPVVRRQLAETVREAKLLRSLLRVAVKADIERTHRGPDTASVSSQGKAVSA